MTASASRAPTRAASRCALALFLLLQPFTPPRALAQVTRPGATSGGEATPQGTAAGRAAVPAGWLSALDRVRAESLRGHLSFIASDALEGRRTPSRGLDIAAEYIAAQFRRAGLEPAGDDGYFQTANLALSGRDMSGFRLEFTVGGERVSVGAERVSVGINVAGLTLWAPDSELTLEGAGVVKVPYGDEAALSALTRGQAEGKVVVTEIPSHLGEGRARATELLQQQSAFLKRLHELGAALVVSFDRGAARGRGAASARLTDPEAPARTAPFGGQSAPLVTAHGAEAAKFYDSIPAGAGAATVAARVPAPSRTPVSVRNVAGVLRGSDETLRDEYVIVSAHYDHVGVKDDCRAGEDCVYNGANDNGSGTVGVIELASALSGLAQRPKRSVLFLTFFGEESGLLGSRYYGRRPLVSLARTVAQINLEQVGRTDDSEGPQVGAAAVTGFDYTGVGAALAAAGDLAGVRFYRHPTKSDAYFGRSDNQALADLGVPAHTVSVTFQFPDYHGVGDEWGKIDYENMARVLRAVGLGVLGIADAPQPPLWDESNQKAARYAEAWRRLHGRQTDP